MDLPEPPEEYSSAEREAWRSGATTALHLLSSQARVLAGHLGKTNAQDGPDDDESCPTCGGELVESFGGAICPTCVHDT